MFLLDLKFLFYGTFNLVSSMMPGLLKDRPDTPKPPEQGIPTRASRTSPPEVVMDPNPGQPMPDIYVRRNVRLAELQSTLWVFSTMQERRLH